MEELNSEILLELLDAREFKKLKEKLENMHPVDIVEVMEEVGERQRVLMFRLLAKEEAAEVFTDMNSDMREDLINALTDSELEEVMEEMYVDDTVDVVEEMPANVVDRLLKATDEETRKKINALLQYPEDSAGSIMNIEYISLRKEMTVEEAQAFVDSGSLGGGMLPKLQNCIDAIENGVSRVHILDGRIPHCLLLEIFTDKGIGTAIYNSKEDVRYYHG